jgi:SAM-dependent methyltransferase
MVTLAADDVRTLFNRKAGSWRRKYAQNGKLHARVERFAGRLCALCPPPARVLDLGCGTGEIAVGLAERGYQVTGCDIAEEMLEVAKEQCGTRESGPGRIADPESLNPGAHPLPPNPECRIEWRCLEPNWKKLPFQDSRFDAVVASSVFEYLPDVPGVAAELARVLRLGGVLLLTVPNPRHAVRRIEARLQSLLAHCRWRGLERFERLGLYAAYLRLSRNRWEGEEWERLFEGAHFAPLDERQFARANWAENQEPLLLIEMKRVIYKPQTFLPEKIRRRTPSPYFSLKRKEL